MVSTPSQQQLTSVSSSSLQIPVDREHSAIRFVVFIIFIIALVGGYIVASFIIGGTEINLLAGAAALIFAGGLATMSERLLKTRWPSGRVIEVNPERISIHKHRRIEREIDPQKQVNVLTWRWTIQKRSRVPKGWYILACALEQDDVYVPVYTFISPQDFERLAYSDLFQRLLGEKELKSGGAERDMRLAGQQRRLHTAEKARWIDGAEITLDEFKTYIEYLQQHFRKWMPSS